MNKTLPPSTGTVRRGTGPVPRKLRLCLRCREFIEHHERLCPHCGSHVAQTDRTYARWRAEAVAKIIELDALLSQLPDR